MRTFWRITWIVAMSCGLAFAQDKKKAAKKPALPEGATLIKDIEYAKVGDISLKLDLVLPKPPEDSAKAAKPPLIVWIHGGAWSKGDKNNNPMAWLAEFGYAAASIDYRLTGVAIFPAQIHDCKAAIRFLRANAAQYGYDESKIGIAGGSAGGHLVALLGTSSDVKELEGTVGGNAGQSSRVQAVLDWYGPTDLYYNATQEKERVDKPDGPLWAFLGGKPSEHTDLAKLASPVHHVTADDPPLLIMHGTADPQVNPQHSKFLYDAYTKAGLPVKLQMLEGAGHGGKEFSEPPARAMIREFFDKNLKTK